MERAIIHSDLTKSEIQPQLLLDKYLEQLSIDIKWMFPIESLQEAFCPVSGEKEVKSFPKSMPQMGMATQLMIQRRRSPLCLSEVTRDTDLPQWGKCCVVY